MGQIMLNGVPYSTGIVKSMADYSTRESLAGYWIDGSIVYEKTFCIHSFSLAQDAKTTIETNFPGDKIISYFGCDVSNTTIYAIPDGRLRLMIENGDLKLASINGGTWSGDAYITIRYTKPST